MFSALAEGRESELVPLVGTNVKIKPQAIETPVPPPEASKVTYRKKIVADFLGVGEGAMPRQPPRTDRVTLNALLTSGRLTHSEQTAFQQMFDDLIGGKVIGLSPKQRLWADSVFERHKLGEVHAAVRKQARARVQKDKTDFFESLPRPLKPPGRT